MLVLAGPPASAQAAEGVFLYESQDGLHAIVDPDPDVCWELKEPPAFQSKNVTGDFAQVYRGPGCNDAQKGPLLAPNQTLKGFPVFSVKFIKQPAQGMGT